MSIDSFNMWSKYIQGLELSEASLCKLESLPQSNNQIALFVLS